MIATNHLGHSIAMRPFLGVMGLPPAEPGHHSTAPPRVTGGNLDCKELIPGTTLFLPVAVEGGLFSTGDGHAAQGDGELSGTAAVIVSLLFVAYTINRNTLELQAANENFLYSIEEARCGDEANNPQLAEFVGRHGPVVEDRPPFRRGQPGPERARLHACAIVIGRSLWRLEVRRRLG